MLQPAGERIDTRVLVVAGNAALLEHNLPANAPKTCIYVAAWSMASQLPRAYNVLASALLPVLACLEHLLVSGYPGLVWHAEGLCMSCLSNQDVAIDPAIFKPVGTLPLTALPTRPSVSCPQCGAATSVAHLLMNFLREGRAADPSLDYEMIRVQKLIEGLGTVEVQDFEDVVSADVEGVMATRRGECKIDVGVGDGC